MVLSALALAICPNAAVASKRSLTIATADGPRTAIVYAHDGASRPTIVVLHGAYVGAANTARTSRFREEAEKRGYNAVFPDGRGRVWNDGRSFRAGVDDVGFIKALVARLVDDGVADPRRTYLAGVSNGGFMTFRMLCDAPEPFAGAGTVIAGVGAETGATCKPRKPMPVIVIAGTADPIVPYAGGGVGFGGRNGKVWGAERSAELFADANSCGAPTSADLADGGSRVTSVTRIAWSCKTSTPVVLYRVNNAGHQSYGGTSFMQFAFGRTTEAFSAPEAILDFFDAVARARP